MKFLFNSISFQNLEPKWLLGKDTCKSRVGQILKRQKKLLNCKTVWEILLTSKVAEAETGSGRGGEFPFENSTSKIIQNHPLKLDVIVSWFRVKFVQHAGNCDHTHFNMKFKFVVNCWAMKLLPLVVVFRKLRNEIVLELITFRLSLLSVLLVAVAES